MIRTKKTETLQPIVALCEAKDWLKLDHSYDDAIVKGVLLSSIEEAESMTRKAFGRNRYETYFDRFSPRLALKKTLVSVSEVGYYDQTWAYHAFTDYHIDPSESLVLPFDYPIDAQKVKVEYVAEGFSEIAKQLVRCLLIYHYERNPEGLQTGWWLERAIDNLAASLKEEVAS